MPTAMNGSPESEGHIERLVQSNARGRLIFLILLLVVPLGLYGIFERQARRLEALGHHGVPTTATVAAVSREQTVYYEYRVDGVIHTWSARHDRAPFAVGERFPITYLPEDPTFSRPGADGIPSIAEAVSNRSFTWKVVAGVFVFFAWGLFMCDARVRRLRRTRKTEADDPEAYRRRLILTGAMLLPLLALVFGWHGSQALRQGESLWPVALGLVLFLAIVGGVGFYALREGRGRVAVRSARVLRWAVPIVLATAVLRAVAWLIERQ